MSLFCGRVSVILLWFSGGAGAPIITATIVQLMDKIAGANRMAVPKIVELLVERFDYNRKSHQSGRHKRSE